MTPQGGRDTACSSDETPSLTSPQPPSEPSRHELSSSNPGSLRPKAKWGAVEWIWRGRQTKDFPGGLTATNTPFQARGSTVVEFRDGKSSRNSDYWDLTTHMKQVGLFM